METECPRVARKQRQKLLQQPPDLFAGPECGLNFEWYRCCELVAGAAQQRDRRWPTFLQRFKGPVFQFIMWMAPAKDRQEVRRTIRRIINQLLDRGSLEKASQRGDVLGRVGQARKRRQGLVEIRLTPGLVRGRSISLRLVVIRQGLVGRCEAGGFSSIAFW